MQETVSIEKMPATIEEFTEMRNRIAVTPFGGAAMFLVAMLVYTENQDLGTQFLTLSLDRKYVTETTRGVHVKGYAPARSVMDLVQYLDSSPYIAFSYVQGTSHEAGYKLPSLPYSFSFLTNRVSEIEKDKMMKVFVESSGADSARPITLQKNDKGIWKTYESSSVFVGVRRPEDNVSDDL